MRRILMVCEAFGGGVFSYVSQLCNDMCEDFDVYLAYSLRPQTPPDFEKFIDKRVHLIEVKNFSAKGLTNIVNDIEVIRVLRNIEMLVKPDIIHLHSSVAGGIGRLAFKGKTNTVIYTPHGYAHILMGKGMKCKVYGTLERILGKVSDAMTLTCCESEDDVAKGLTKRTAYIETGINMKDLSASLDGIEPIKNDKFTVFTLGRACVQKQPQLFNRIAELVPEARFVWVGNGELENLLTAPNVEVTGWKPRKEALALAKGADVFILCSLGEAVAMSLIENMFIKKLCLVSNTMGNKSVIKDGINGYICTQPEEYAERIKQAMRVFPTALAEQAYEDVLSTYNTESMKAKYIAFYNTQIGTKPQLRKEKEYDYLVVGSGLFGATFAYKTRQRGKRCLVIDKRPHLGGNVYCENVEGINVHKYGAHIFHTSNKEVWDFVNSIVEFNRYTNSPVANYQGKLYNLPFNMNTFYQMWGVTTPEDATAIIEEQKAEAMKKMKADGATQPRNLEEQAQVLIGKDIYEKLIKGYTEKQWGRSCTELPAFIIRRLPVRLIFDNNYFNDFYQGIPIGGYNKLVDGLLKGIETKTNTDFFDNREYWEGLAEKIVFTGKIDEFYGYRFGKLNYRTVRFEQEAIDTPNYQGNAVVNYTEREIPYTRIIEHKHFEMFGQSVYDCPKTVISKEYSTEWAEGMEPYYPINDYVNNELYSKYKALADKETNVIFGGRLAEYKYYDMDKIIERALESNAIESERIFARTLRGGVNYEVIIISSSIELPSFVSPNEWRATA